MATIIYTQLRNLTVPLVEPPTAHATQTVYFSLADADALIRELESAEDEISRTMRLVSWVSKIGAQNDVRR